MTNEIFLCFQKGPLGKENDTKKAAISIEIRDS